jgi:hypothetical protein
MTRYNSDQLASFPWIVSTDTLRTDHLADAYLGAFDRLGQDVPEPFRSDLQQCAAYASDLTGPEPCDAWEIATAWAFDRLGELAPTGFYFGASEGDGACFGFWLCEDWAEALEDRGIDCEDPTGTAELIQAFEDHGIEAEQLCDAYCGTADGYSEAQAGAAYAEELADGNGLLDREPAWPYTCIDWADAWRELEIGDGYSLIPETPTSWHVVRSV